MCLTLPAQGLLSSNHLPPLRNASSNGQHHHFVEMTSTTSLHKRLRLHLALHWHCSRSLFPPAFSPAFPRTFPTPLAVLVRLSAWTATFLRSPAVDLGAGWVDPDPGYRREGSISCDVTFRGWEGEIARNHLISRDNGHFEFDPAISPSISCDLTFPNREGGIAGIRNPRDILGLDPSRPAPRSTAGDRKKSFDFLRSSAPRTS